MGGGGGDDLVAHMCDLRSHLGGSEYTYCDAEQSVLCFLCVDQRILTLRFTVYLLWGRTIYTQMVLCWCAIGLLINMSESDLLVKINLDVFLCKLIFETLSHSKEVTYQPTSSIDQHRRQRRLELGVGKGERGEGPIDRKKGGRGRKGGRKRGRDRSKEGGRKGGSKRRKVL